MYTCDNHNGVFVFTQHWGTGFKCPICSEIEELKEEIKNLEEIERNLWSRLEE